MHTFNYGLLPEKNPLSLNIWLVSKETHPIITDLHFMQRAFSYYPCIVHANLVQANDATTDRRHADIRLMCFGPK